jgi:hypothetical protein
LSGSFIQVSLVDAYTVDPDVLSWTSVYNVLKSSVEVWKDIEGA